MSVKNRHSDIKSLTVTNVPGGGTMAGLGEDAVPRVRQCELSVAPRHVFCPVADFP